MVDAVHELAENIHLLRKLREAPKIILVVVLEDKRHAAFLRFRQTRLDIGYDDVETLRLRQLRTSLARQYAAKLRAERRGHANPRFLFFDFLPAQLRIGLRKI